MPWWKALLADLGLAALATGIVFIYARSWIRHRTEMTWPLVVGTVTDRTNGRGSGGKGRPYTYLVGHYDYRGDQRHFSVGWAPSDFDDRTWVPPKGTPSVGSTVLVHANPSNPSNVVLDSDPMRSTANDVTVFALIILPIIAAAITVWFM